MDSLNHSTVKLPEVTESEVKRILRHRGWPEVPQKLHLSAWSIFVRCGCDVLIVLFAIAFFVYAGLVLKNDRVLVKDNDTVARSKQCT